MSSFRAVFFDSCAVPDRVKAISSSQKNRYRRSASSATRVQLDFVAHSLCRTGDEIDLEHFYVDLWESVLKWNCVQFWLFFWRLLEFCEFQSPELHHIVAASVWFLRILDICALWRRSHLSAGKWRASESACFLFSIVDCWLIQDRIQHVFLGCFCILRGLVSHILPSEVSDSLCKGLPGFPMLGFRNRK